MVDELEGTANDGPEGLDAYVTGPAGQAADQAEAFEGIDSILLFSAVGVVIVILLLTYRSPVLWLLPVISAGVALTVAQAVVVPARQARRPHRRRPERQHPHRPGASVPGPTTPCCWSPATAKSCAVTRAVTRRWRIALHRAGPAIVASGATVAIGLLCLLLAQMNSTRGLGPVAAIGIVCGLAVMLIMLPALLVVLGRWIFWPLIPHFGDDDPSAHGVWAGVGRRIARAPRRVWVVTTLILAIAGLGIVQLNATGLSNEEAFHGSSRRSRPRRCWPSTSRVAPEHPWS